jgi:hypothetical protein
MSHVLAALLAIAVPYAAPPIAPATIDETLEVDGESLAARQVKTRMTVAVAVNGQGPFRFLVDSGADRSVVGAALAVRLDLPARGVVTLHGMAGTSRVGTVSVDRLQVGGNVIRDLSLPALSEANLGAQGLLGIDALAGQRVMLDFDAKTITFQDTRRPPPATAGPDEIVITARRRGGQLIITEAGVGRTGISAVVDTGSEITIGNKALYAAVFGRRRKPPESVSTSLISVTGAVLPAEMIVLPEVRLGGLTLRNVTLAFVDAPPFALFGLADKPAILLGTDVLEVFRRVSLDFSRRRIRFLMRS